MIVLEHGPRAQTLATVAKGHLESEGLPCHCNVFDGSVSGDLFSQCFTVSLLQNIVFLSMLHV